MPSPAENQGISQQKKTPETPQGDHERSAGHKVPEHDTPQQVPGNNNNNQVTEQFVRHGRRHYADYCELFRDFVSNLNTMQQIPHGAPYRAMKDTNRLFSSYFQAVDTTPSVSSKMIYIGGIAGNRGKTCMRYDFDSLIRIGVPQHMWPAIKFHYVHCNPEKNMVFVCVTHVWAAHLLCLHIHHRFFFDTAKQTLCYGPTKDCGEEMFQALQFNNAEANGDVAVLVDKNTLRNIVTCEVKDPNYSSRNHKNR